MCLKSVTIVMKNVNTDLDENKPSFWLVEDGEFYLADSAEVLKCAVCKKWFLSKQVPKAKAICSPGCKLRLTDKKENV